jgi:DNA topoisomerase-1
LAKRKLIVVESPTKARTIKKFLGRNYAVESSMGHVRDLPKSKLGVEVEKDFAPSYVVPRDKSATVKKLTEHARKASEVLLATDPDREGEAIAWHLLEALKRKMKNQDLSAKRVVFHEITEDAVRHALDEPRDINADLVDAQQARRVLDRLVGYKMSPFLWRKVQRGLSAGRVQSVALRLIVDREREIEAFAPQEYWSLHANLAKRPAKRAQDQFDAELVQVSGKKPEINDGETAENIVAELDGAAWPVQKISVRDRRRRPSAPYTTSTMQQDASGRLNLGAARTMRLAQQLYEGIEIGGEGQVGLITYMRTDSVQVSNEAIAQVRQFIGQTFGSDEVPEKPNRYTSRVKNAQEAHEAIRPTSVLRTPEQMREFLDASQLKLYTLIWQRFVSSQMRPAVLQTTSVDVVPQRDGADLKYRFRASATRVKNPGFYRVYRADEEQADEKNSLPPLAEREELDLNKLWPEQHFTQPPPRFTEASLIRALEEEGIGRPSTYAPILSVIQERTYVERERRTLKPTELGTVVRDMLVKHFPDIIKPEFTAAMEEDLDAISRGEKRWTPVLEEFYGDFSEALAKADQEAERVKAPVEETGEMCEECGKPLLLRSGRFGKFIGCSGFPQCRNTKPYLDTIGVDCPQCGQGEIVRKLNKRRNVFYSCSRYPDCEYASSRPPAARKDSAEKAPAKEPAEVAGD